MRKPIVSLAAAVLAAGAALAAPPAGAGDTGATYKVTFNGTWSKATHPIEYPAGAHFSGLIGATHNNGYVLFRVGKVATRGLKNLSEHGQHSPFDKEIRAAIAAGTAGTLIETNPIFGPPGTSSVTFKADARHPMVSLAAMIAPSPDWFAGVANVRLYQNGKWVMRRTLTVYAYDAGTDDGLTYEADDKESKPWKPARLNDSRHFKQGGKRVAVGTITFERVMD
jgi:Spondin_N